MSENNNNNNGEQSDDRNMQGFYRTAFWWMMGLGGSGIVGSIAMAVQLNVAVGRLEVQMVGLSESYRSLSSTVERAAGDRYTSTTAAVDKRTLSDRIDAMDSRIDANANLIMELRIWKASVEKQLSGGSSK